MSRFLRNNSSPKEISALPAQAKEQARFWRATQAWEQTKSQSQDCALKGNNRVIGNVMAMLELTPVFLWAILVVFYRYCPQILYFFFRNFKPRFNSQIFCFQA